MVFPISKWTSDEAMKAKRASKMKWVIVKLEYVGDKKVHALESSIRDYFSIE